MTYLIILYLTRRILQYIHLESNPDGVFRLQRRRRYFKQVYLLELVYPTPLRLLVSRIFQGAMSLIVPSAMTGINCL